VINPTISSAMNSLFLMRRFAASMNLPLILIAPEDARTEYAYPT
jgi:hypothetical protein